MDNVIFIKQKMYKKFDKNKVIVSSIFVLLIIILLISITSCDKEEKINTDSSVKLEFSSDTIIFDTVFTTIGSTTKKLMIYNKEKQKIKISSISLARGEDSPFKINIDGAAVTDINDIEIRGGDSLYIFVRITINPNNNDNPLIQADSIIFETNGNLQDIDLVAWGQDANYITPDTYRNGFPAYKIIVHENENITWENNKPYVIYGYAVIDSTGVLNINQGTKIYFHQNSGIWVYKGGSIKVNGTINEPVYFQGDRLEEFYKDIPGQWDRIWLNESSVDNEFNYAIIRNSHIGIQAETLNSQMGNKLIIKNTIIENMTGIGIFSRNYNIVAANNVISNCGGYNIALTLGGNYDFRHCTIANFWDYSVRNTPAVYFNNYIEYADEYGNVSSHNDFDLTKAYFGNCIIYGNNDDEIEPDKRYSAEFNFTFDHCLLKTEKDISEPNYIDCLKNLDPLFKNIEENNFEIDTVISPAVNAGSINIVNSSILNISTDINGENRIEDSNPDLGAYEFFDINP